MRLIWLLVFAVGCGGKIDGDDGGAGGVDSGASKDGQGKSDVIIIPPTSDAGPPQLCALGMGEGSVGSDGSCSASQDWTCGAVKYTVACNCPKAACFCTTGNQSATVLTTLMCPSCDVSGSTLDSIAKLCGFPPP